MILFNDYVKDLNLLGRDIKRMVIVDNSEKAFAFQKSNGILIKAFDGSDDTDCVLENLEKIIEENNISYLRLQFTDMLGDIKAVEIPISKLDDA